VLCPLRRTVLSLKIEDRNSASNREGRQHLSRCEAAVTAAGGRAESEWPRTVRRRDVGDMSGSSRKRPASAAQEP
jgi:hypothetical protein